MSIRKEKRARSSSPTTAGRDAVDAKDTKEELYLIYVFSDASCGSVDTRLVPCSLLKPEHLAALLENGEYDADDDIEDILQQAIVALRALPSEKLVKPKTGHLTQFRIKGMFIVSWH